MKGFAPTFAMNTAKRSLAVAAVLGLAAGFAFTGQPAVHAQEEAPAEKEVDIQGAVKAANQRASDEASDKLGIPRDFTGTGS